MDCKATHTNLETKKTMIYSCPNCKSLLIMRDVWQKKISCPRCQSILKFVNDDFELSDIIEGE